MKKIYLMIVFLFSVGALASIMDIALPEAKVNQSYKTDLKEHLPMGDTYEYHLVAGPAWATLSEKGLFEGKPTTADLGKNDFFIQYCNSAVCGSDAATIFVR